MLKKTAAYQSGGGFFVLTAEATEDTEKEKRERRREHLCFAFIGVRASPLASLYVASGDARTPKNAFYSPQRYSREEVYN